MPEAYLPAAFFTRESVRKVQQKRIQDFIEEQEQEIIKETARVTAAALSKEEAEQRGKAMAQRRELVGRLKAAAATGRIVIKLMPPEKLKGSEFDLELEEGDTLDIPMTPSTVMVMGRVYNPNAILYNKDKPLEFYLNKVGGPAENADEKRIYLVKADGTVLSRTQSSFWGFRWDAESQPLVCGRIHGRQNGSRRHHFSPREIRKDLLGSGDQRLDPDHLPARHSHRRPRRIILKNRQ